MKPRVLRYRVQPYRWPRTYDRIQHSSSNRPDLQKKQRKTKSQWFNQNQIRMMQAHEHEQNCLQIDPTMNQTIDSTPKLSWASDHERKFNFGGTSKSQRAWSLKWIRDHGPMQIRCGILCRSIVGHWSAQSFVTDCFFFFKHRPEATGQARAVQIWSDTAFQFKPWDILMNVSSVSFL